MSDRPAAPPPAPGRGAPSGPAVRPDQTAVRPTLGGPGRTSERPAPNGRPAADQTVKVPVAVPPAGPVPLAKGANRPSGTANQPAAAAAAKPAAQQRPARRARLRLTRVDPWSVMKTSFLLAIAFGIVTLVSVLVVWTVLGAAGVWDSINATVANVIGGEDGVDFKVEDYLSTSRVLGFTTVIAVLDVVLLTAISTLTAFLYNMAAALLGGLEVTLAEDPH